MPAARRSVAFGLATVGLLTLTGCDKPNPTVTVFSGSSSNRAEAICWSRSGKAVDTSTCGSEEKVGAISVRANQTVGISVDPKIADSGWIVAVGQSQLTPRKITETYFRFTLTPQELASGPLRLQVVAVDKAGTAPVGRWLFDLKTD